MADESRSYIEAFFNVTKGLMKKNEETSTVKFLKSAIDSLTTILNKIDKYLLSKDVNVKEEFATLKDKLSNYKEKGKASLLSAKDDIKQNGLKSFVTAKKDAVVGKLKDKFSTDTEKSGAPPEENKEGVLTSLLKKLSDSIDGLTSATNGKIDNDDEKKSTEKEGRLARFKNMLDQQKARADKRKAEVDAEKNRFGKKEGKDGKGKGVLGMLLSAITGLGGMILGGFKGILLKLVPMLAGAAGRGIVRTIVGLAPWMAKRIVPSLVTATKGILGTVGKGILTGGASLLWGGAKALGTAALGAATGTAGLVIGGVLLAGAAIYGGYKLYKYLNRNSTGDGVYGDLTRLRLQLYGFSDMNREHYHKLFDLEMLMKNYHEYRNNNVILKKFDGDFKKKVLELFEVTREEKEKYALLNTWFIKRFLPGYKAFLEAMYAANSKIYLDDLDKLKDEELFKLISVLRIPVSIYDVKSIPVFDKPDTTVDKQQIDDLLNNIREAIKKKSTTGKGRDPKQVSNDNKQNAKDNKVAQDMDSKAIKDQAKSMLPPPSTSNQRLPSANKNDMSAPAGSGVEGESKPKEAPSEKLSDKAIGKLNQATGSLQTGNKALEGIATKLDMSKIYNLDPNVLELFSGMAKEYHNLTGKVINVNEAFRSRQDQEAMFRKYGPGRAARPGTSLHEHGLAIDINSVTADELDKLGLMRKYGFTRPIGGEKWHLEPAGVALNPVLARDNPNSRIGAVTTSPGRGGGGYATDPSATKYKRNVALQKSIYESGNSSEVDPMKQLGDKLKTMSDTGALSPNSNSSLGGNQTPQPVGGSYTNSTSTDKSATGGEESRTQNRTSGVNLYGKTAESGGMPTPDFERKPPTPGTSKGLDQPPQPSGLYSNNMDPSKMGSMSPEDAIRKASSVTGMNANTMLAFAKIESSMDPNAANKKSTATGLFQITGPTWKGLMEKYGKQYNIPPDAKPTDPYYNSLLGSLYAKENLKSLGNYQQAGIREDVALYLAHHFGASGGNRIIKAASQNPGAHARSAMSDDAYSSNVAELGNKTIGQYIEFLNNKLNKAGSNLQTPPSPKPLLAQGAVSPETNKPAGTGEQVGPPAPGAPTPSQAKPQPGVVVPSAPTSQSPSSAPQPGMSPYRPTLPPQEPQQQLTKMLSLDKTEHLLTGMSDTLVAIKDILSAISENGGMTSDKKQGSETPAAPAEQKPIVVDNNRQPSQTAVSMSRRPVRA